ncbi:MAG TPA: NAD-dependent epimerase/dehydratase family protein, partial [Minicystis sp.]|nr:NAD-dependent epimerase/dehydratase family protein [Minicystis sp.]
AAARERRTSATLSPVKTVVTGATGLLGGNLADALIQAGHDVVATRRASSRADHLAHLPIRWKDADLADAGALARAFDGADVVFHCAASVDILPTVTPALRDANVGGTERVIAAVRRARVARLVHCSSTTAAGVSDGSRDVTEADPWNLPEHGLDDGYATTKREAQERVLAAVEQGLDAVVCQPAYMLGPYDARPSSGQLVVEIARRRIPFAAPGMQNVVDVRDVARGMILAWQKGRRGEVYILGGENMTYVELFARIGRACDVAPPTRVLPYFLPISFATVVELGARALGVRTAISRPAIRYGYAMGYRFSSDKARRELGYAPGSPDDGLRACVAWLREHGKLP